MASDSVLSRWTIAAGTMRVECNSGHAEVVPVAGSATVCDHRANRTTTTVNGLPGTPCGKTRVIVKSGAFTYDPTNLVQKAAIQLIVTW